MDNPNIKGTIVGPPILNVEVRLMIWRYLYAVEPPRIVEVQTAKHKSGKGHRKSWCTRYSPSPAPLVVNICNEARYEAKKIALTAGHILFATTQPKTLQPIYFDPDIDTLYVRNEKEHWIRGRTGILTQLQRAWNPKLLRELAIEIDPIERATNDQTFRHDLEDFPNLEKVVFVADKPDDEICKLVKSLNGVVEAMNRDAEYATTRGRTRSRTRVEGCELATRWGRCFVSVNFE